jgi:hypothetical protein
MIRDKAVGKITKQRKSADDLTPEIRADNTRNTEAIPHESLEAFATLTDFLHKRNQEVVVIALPVRKVINENHQQREFRDTMKVYSRRYAFDYYDLSTVFDESDFYADSFVYFNYSGKTKFAELFFKIIQKYF